VGGHADTNLYDAIALGTRRIGHGLASVWHPAILEHLKTEQNIALEICPISNVVLKYTGGGVDFRSHPIFSLIQFGVPVVIAPDDPAIFGVWMSETDDDDNAGSSGIVSYDILALMLAQPDVVSLSLLKKWFSDSIKFSLDNHNQEHMEQWNLRWHNWVNRVVAQHQAQQ
jgi:adenosine deaminase CECR1